MSIDNDKFEKIAAYLAGHLDQEERKSLDEWRTRNEKSALEFREAELIWRHSVLKPEYTGDAELEWKELEEKIENEKSVPLWKNSWIRIAATLTAIVVLAVWLLPKNDAESIAVIQTYSSGDAVRTIYLSDSTLIWLGKNSKINVLEGYGSKNRTVQLEGQAYFNVTKNAASPFIINTSKTRTEVLGTSFDLCESNKETTLEVAEGTVQFGTSDAPHDKIILKAGDAARITGQTPPAKYSVDPTSIGKWRLLDNEVFNREKTSPLEYIIPAYKWNKNAINQSVIKGMLKSDATLADYKNITLSISYKKANGKVVKTTLKLSETLKADQAIYFEKRLLDVFTDTRDLKVDVLQAQTVE